jgi:hypothetical protein
MGSHEWPRRPEQDVTVVLPAVDPDATMVLPVVQPTPAVADDDTTASVTRNSAVMAVGSLASRLTGFVRTVVIGAAIGAKAFSDDYTLANTLPNMVYELLLGGVLASVVVPLLVRARTRDSDRTPRAAAHGAGGGQLVGGRQAPHHGAGLPPAPGDLLLRGGRAARRDPEHPRPLRGADVDADPQQRRGDRHGRRVHADLGQCP